MYLKDGNSTGGIKWAVELSDGYSSHQPANGQHYQVPVVGVTQEEGVLVGIGQVEDGESYHLTYKQHTHQYLQRSREKDDMKDEKVLHLVDMHYIKS